MFYAFHTPDCTAAGLGHGSQAFYAFHTPVSTAAGLGHGSQALYAFHTPDSTAAGLGHGSQASWHPKRLPKFGQVFSPSCLGGV